MSRENLCFTVVFEGLVRGKLLFVADAYIHDFPSLEEKIGICREVVDFAKLFVIRPKVVALAAIETVNPSVIPVIVEWGVSKPVSRILYPEISGW